MSEQINILKKEVEFERSKNRTLEENRWKISGGESPEVSNSFIKKIEYLESELENKVKTIGGL